MKRFRFTFHRGSRAEAEQTAVEFDSLYDLIKYLVLWYNESDFSVETICYDDVCIELYSAPHKLFVVKMPFWHPYDLGDGDGYFKISPCGFFEEINL